LIASTVRSKRKSILHDLLPRGGSNVVFGADHVVGRGVDFFRAVCARDCEGVVAKLAQSPYRLLRGRSPWLKVRNPNYTQIDGRHDLFLQRHGRR